MKYYIRLIKRRYFKAFVACLLINLLGLACIMAALYDSLILISEKISFNYSINFTEIIEAIDPELFVIGILIIILAYPSNSAYAQNESDYDIKSEKEYIYVRYKKNEFLVKKETLSPTDFYYRDKNKRFVSMMRGYQIYNYILIYHQEVMDKDIDESKRLSKQEFLNNFKDIKKITAEEKINLLDNNNIKNKKRLNFIIISILLWSNFIFWTLGLSISLLENEIKMPEDISFVITSITMIILSFIFGKKSNKEINKDKKTYSFILNSDIYIIECKIYDIKVIPYIGKDGNKYVGRYVKITDGNYVLNEWIEVTGRKYIERSKYTKIYYQPGLKENEQFLINKQLV